MLWLWDSQKIGKWNRFGKHKKKNIPKTTVYRKVVPGDCCV